MDLPESPGILDWNNFLWVRPQKLREISQGFNAIPALTEIIVHPEHTQKLTAP